MKSKEINERMVIYKNQKLKNEFYSIEKKIENLKEFQKDLLEQYASINCPYCIGDIIDIHQHCYKGMKGIVKKISGLYYSCTEFVWRVEGIILDKNGIETVYRFDFNETDIY